MIGRIAHHECRIIWRDHRFRWTTGMLAVLLVVAVTVSAQIFGRRSAATAAAQQEQREQWLHKSVSNAHVAAHAGTTLFRPSHALAVLAYVVYFSLFIGLGLIVSARSRTAQGALITLIGFWLLVSFLAPRGAFALAQQLYPAPSAEEFAAAIERIDQAGNVGFLQQRAAIERRLLAKYRIEKPADLPVSTWGMTLYEREVESTERYNQQFARIFDAYERQQRLVDAISIAAPSLALRSVSMALAGTDTAHYRHFAEAAEAYRYALVQTMNTMAIDSRLYNSSPTLAAAPDQAPFPDGEAVAYQRVGPFVYRTPSSQWALWNVGAPAGALLAWSMVIGLALVGTVRSVRPD